MIAELPQNTEAEKSTLGSIIISRDALIKIAPWMQAAWFYQKRHAALYAAILSLYRTSGTTDLKTLMVTLKGAQIDQIGGAEYIADLIGCALPWQVETYAREVERCAVLRGLVEAGTTITRLGYSYDLSADEARGSASQALSKVASSSDVGGLVSFDTLADRQYEWLNAGVVPGIPTDYRDLDEMTGGLHNGDLVVLAARPSMGKTSMALGLAYNIAKRQAHDVLFFSLEMDKDQLMQRAAAMESGVNLHSIRTMHMGPDAADKYMSALGTLAALPVFVDDKTDQGTAGIRAIASRHQAERARPMVVMVDYLQLMATPGFKPADRVAAVSSLSRELKILAKELDCPVVALSQLSRALEARQSKVPMLSDLRESGAIEQDADIVLFIYREEIYEPDTDQKGIAQLHIGKHRNGPLGVAPMRFDASTTRFDTLTYREPEGR